MLNIAKLNEEINLLYVAVTRTRHQLYIPESLLPAGFSGASYIHVQGKKGVERSFKAAKPQSSAQSFLAKRRAAKTEEKAFAGSGSDAYQPWTPDLDKALRKMAETRASIGKIAAHFGRTKGAIYARLKKLGYFAE
jgi:ATP-dependent exoDNAse (exonuclease V) beta subunit